MGVNCSISGISPAEVEVIKKRSQGEAPPHVLHLFRPSQDCRAIPGYDVDLHRDFYGFHRTALTFGEPLSRLSSVEKLSSYYDELVSLYGSAAQNDVALMVMLAQLSSPEGHGASKSLLVFFALWQGAYAASLAPLLQSRAA